MLRPVARRKGFALFLAIGVIAVLFLLAMAASFSAQSARSVVRLQGDRDEQTAVRASLESLARTSPRGLASEGSINLGKWQISWKTIALKDSPFAGVEEPKGGAAQVARVTGWPDSETSLAPAFIQDLLLVRQPVQPWTAAAWKAVASQRSPSPTKAPGTPKSH